MTTPIYDFIKRKNAEQLHRFFMPGHKGKPLEEFFPLDAVFPWDITEITGADALYEAEGIIGESEQNAAKLFGARDTLYSAGGSTLCIQTMVGLLAKRGKKIIAGRNAHMAFIHTCTLLGIEPVWILPEQSDSYGICGLCTPQQIQRALEEHRDAVGVYITSPDYLGNTADVGEIAGICRKYGVPLLCDNAHGAYLKFGGTAHPMDLGVSACCDSAHKTLPVLTGGAYLHLGEGFPFSKEEAKEMMHYFGSSSPSYLILTSLDLCNRFLAEQGEAVFSSFRRRMERLQKEWKRRDIPFLEGGDDFAKLTVDALAMGRTGTELQEHLKKYQIECEYVNSQYAVLMCSPFHAEEELELLTEALSVFERYNGQKQEDILHFSYELPPRKLLPSEVFWKDAKTLPLEATVGRISAQTVASCPPGVPVVIQGEIITPLIKKNCENSGIFYLKVI